MCSSPTISVFQTLPDPGSVTNATLFLPLSTKNTILKKYDGRFKDIFEEIYEKWEQPLV